MKKRCKSAIEVVSLLTERGIDVQITVPAVGAAEAAVILGARDSTSLLHRAQGVDFEDAVANLLEMLIALGELKEEDRWK